MVCDIGGGTTEVAIISLSANAYSESLRVAGDEMDEAIVRHLQKKYQVAIGVNAAERIKMEVGSAYSGAAPGQRMLWERISSTAFPRPLRLQRTT